MDFFSEKRESDSWMALVYMMCLKILLCHHPEYYDRYLADKDIDLILAGMLMEDKTKLAKENVNTGAGCISYKYMPEELS